MKRTPLSALCGAALLSVASAASAITPFETDVATAIDRRHRMAGEQSGAFNNPSSAADANGLSMLALAREAGER